MRPRASIIPVFIPHLGCPCRCVFCNQHSITADAYASAAHQPDAEDVVRIIEEGLARVSDGAELAFYGGSFTALDEDLRKAYLEAAFPFVCSGKISGIRISTRPDAIDDRKLDELRYYGVKTIELGAQSMDDRVLTLAARGHTAEDTRRASHKIKDAGFQLILQMMVGLPGENAETPMQTAKQIAALMPDGVRIYPVAVIKNTELAQLYENGLYKPLSVDEAVDVCADLMDFFDSKGIPVIRVGLNPTLELESEVQAGVYHPAFGELCRSRIYLRLAERLLAEAEVPTGSTVVFGVEQGKVSMLMGQHRQNAEKLKKQKGLRDIKVREIRVDSSEPKRTNKIYIEILEIY